MKNVIICDDHKIVREGIKQIINSFPEFEVTAEAESGETLMRVIKDERPDVIVLDVSLPGRSGLEVLKQLKLMYPEVNILVLSMYPEDQFAIRMLKAGASGYLHKDVEPAILNKALNTVSSGGEFLSEKISQLLFHSINAKDDDAPHHTLSDREFEVLLYIGEGKSISDIANQLSLSVKTISTYRTRILEKLRLNSNSDMVKYIMMHELNLAY